MQTATAELGFAVPREEKGDASRQQAYRQHIDRLSRQSVAKHFDAYTDVPWDDPAYAVDPADPRFVLAADDPLAATAWYQSQPIATQARIGLHTMATFMRIGRYFESVLTRGILEFVNRLPDSAPEIRYAYHEVIEESQHSLMFYELVRRSGLETRLPPILGLAERQVVSFGRTFPELFFFFILAGEDPIDWQQRRILQNGEIRHPLLERITRIHVTEEARHMSFARHYLRRHVPALRGLKLFKLRLRTPMILAVAASLMLKPSRHVAATYCIPKDVIREAYGPGSLYRRHCVEALRKPRQLCWELGVLNDRWSPLWKRLGIWAPQGA